MTRFFIIFLSFMAYLPHAHADSAVIYRGSYGSKECKEFTADNPQAVFEVCFPMHAKEGLSLSHNPARGQYYYDVLNRGGLGIQSVIGTVKTCEAKELTNGGRPISDRPDYYDERFVNDPVLSRLFSEKAPPGIDAADWFPDRFKSCVNNCVVSNQRYTSENVGRSTTESEDGTSRSVFFKTQTGEVCVPEKKKPNDPPKPPPPDTDNGSNGQSGGDTGSDNGNGQGGSDGNSGGSNNGNGGSDGSDSGNDGSDSGNDGSGGGSSGGGGYTGVPGGGTSGGQNGAGSDDGGDSGDGGQGSDGGDGGSGNGNSGGSGSDQGSGDGAVDGGGEGSSISGGNCAANQAPSCTGDAVQCFIAREQWRTACAATGEGSKVSGTDCKASFECSGDAVQCYIAKTQRDAKCARDDIANAAQSVGKMDLGDGITLGSAAKTATDFASQFKQEINVNTMLGDFDTSGFLTARQCFASNKFSVGGYEFEIDWNLWCLFLEYVGYFMVAVGYWHGLRIFTLGH